MKPKPNTIYADIGSGHVYITDINCNGITLISPLHNRGAHTYSWKATQWQEHKDSRIELGSSEDLRKILIDKIKKT